MTPSLRALEGLGERLEEILVALPGATTLYLFGSLADGRADQYSDMDLRVVTDDLPASLAARHSVLSRIGPLALEWTITSTPSEWAATVLWQHTSPYHKLDIGFVAADLEEQLPSRTGDSAVRLWTQPSARMQEPWQLPPVTAPYIATIGTAEHFLLGHLLGATRYLKARCRGRSMTCWRFAVAVAQAVAETLYAASRGEDYPSSRLSTLEYEVLDLTLAKSERREFLERLDFSTPEAMDRNVYRLLKQLAESFLSGPALGEPPSAERVVAQLLAFFEAEITLR